MKNTIEKITPSFILNALKQQENFEVQTLILSKEKFKTKDEANSWVKENKFEIKDGAPDETENSWRYRQFEPELCVSDSHRTFEITDGVQAVGCKKREGDTMADPKLKSDKSFSQIFAMTKEIDTKSRSVVAWANAKVTDRSGELVLPKAFEKYIDRFLKNPVLMPMHNYGALPVGSISEIAMEDSGLKFRANFAKTAFAEEMYQLYKDGHMRAFSIGYIPHETREATDDEKKEFGEIGLVHTSTELLEISCVPIPMNQDSLAISVNGYNPKDMKSIEDFIKWVKDLRESIPAKPLEKNIHEHIAKLKEIATMLSNTIMEMAGGEENPPEEESVNDPDIKRLLDEIRSLPQIKK